MGLLDNLDIFSNIFNAGYKIYQDKRDFNYQTDLQNQLFQRDDTALQRRMADAKAAGLNPLAVLGQSAGNTSAGGFSSTPLSLDNHFFSKQESAKIQREQIKDEIDKRQLDKELMKIQIRSGKIANLQALTDLNTKNMEHEILKNQLEQMRNLEYFPYSNLGKSLYDLSTILQYNLPGGINPLNPFPTMHNFLYGQVIPGVKQVAQTDIIPKIQEKINEMPKTVGEFVEDIKDKYNLYNKKVGYKEAKKREYEAKILRGASDSRLGVSHKSKKF